MSALSHLLQFTHLHPSTPSTPPSSCLNLAMLVGWTWGSWSALKKKRELIIEGWKKCGLGDVLNAAQQVEAMRFCMTAAEEVLGSEPEVVEEAGTDSEGEEEPDAAVDHDAV